VKTRPLAAAVLAAVGVTGCARMSPGLGFDEVSQGVHSRLGAAPRWNRGTREDAEAQRALAMLLARELTADAAVQIALLNNRDLQATYEELDIAQADLVRAGLLRNPVFSGELRFDTEGGGTGIGLDIAQDFLSLLTMSLRRSAASAGFEATKARVTAEVVRTAFETRAAFHEYQAAEEIAGLRETVVQATAASAELARRVREAGNTPELDLLGEQVLHEQAQLDLENASADAAQARERLNVLMGVWGEDTRWRAAARLPELGAGDDMPFDAERLAIAASLDLVEARALVDQTAISARLARPVAWLDGAEAGATAEREVEGGWSVGPTVSVPIPVFDLGGAARGEAAARLRQAANRYYATAVRVRASTRAAVAAVEWARARVLQHQTVILPLHERIVQQAQLQYNAMQISGFQLLQTKRDHIAAGVSSIEALRDYWTARASLDRLIAGAPAALEGARPNTLNRTTTSASGAEGH